MFGILVTYLDFDDTSPKTTRGMFLLWLTTVAITVVVFVPLIQWLSTNSPSLFWVAIFIGVTMATLLITAMIEYMKTGKVTRILKQVSSWVTSEK